MTEKTAYKFLAELFAPYPTNLNLSCEIRSLWLEETDEPNPQDWFAMTHIEKAAGHAHSLADGMNVYMGVLPRNGKRGDAQYVTHAAWLWCDIDAGTGTGRECFDLQKKSGLPTPHMMVFSGSGGAHLYWKLDSVVPLTNTQDRALYKSLLRRIVFKIGGTDTGAHADMSAADVARVLRVPSTLNHKWTPPRDVRLMLFDKAECKSLLWWEANLPAEPRITPKAVQYANKGSGTEEARIEGLRRHAEKGYPEGKRHHDLTGYTAWLIRECNVTEDMARELLRIRIQHSHGSRQITEREAEDMISWAFRKR